MSRTLSSSSKERKYRSLKTSKKLKRSWFIALMAVLIAFASVATATFAWYVYNINAHTTRLRMAAGTSISLEIANSYDGKYGRSASLSNDFVGSLNPVSTDKILNGFQKVYGFTDGSDTQSNLMANLFKKATSHDFYKTSLFVRTNGGAGSLYIADLDFKDSEDENPISSAIRVGFVVHEPGRDKDPAAEYIFAISDKKNPEALYNTITGREGYVLDSTKQDGNGATVPFDPYTKDNFCAYDKNTGKVSVGEDSLILSEISGAPDGSYGDSVQIDVYIWLEGCDEDCVRNLVGTTLRDLSITFAVYNDFSK